MIAAIVAGFPARPRGVGSMLRRVRARVALVIVCAAAACGHRSSTGASAEPVLFTLDVEGLPTAQGMELRANGVLLDADTGDARVRGLVPAALWLADASLEVTLPSPCAPRTFKARVVEKVGGGATPLSHAYEQQMRTNVSHEIAGTLVVDAPPDLQLPLPTTVWVDRPAGGQSTLTIGPLTLTPHPPHAERHTLYGVACPAAKVAIDGVEVGAVDKDDTSYLISMVPGRCYVGEHRSYGDQRNDLDDPLADARVYELPRAVDFFLQGAPSSVKTGDSDVTGTTLYGVEVGDCAKVEAAKAARAKAGRGR